MARTDLRKELAMVRKGGLKASGVRHWGPATQRWMFHRTIPGTFAGAVGEAVDKRLKAGKEFLGIVKREIVAPADHQVQQANSRLRSRRAPAPGAYTGDPAPTVVKGKGRSTSLGDIYKPSKELRIDEPPERRLGSIFSGAGGRRQSGATMLSNYGANKENGQGYVGMSAGRARGAVNILKHPETFMSRFLWVYAAKHVTQQVTDWRGWNKVSWTMTDNQAQRTLSEHQAGQPDAVKAIAGGITAAGISVASALTDSWLGLMTLVPSMPGFLLGEGTYGRLSESQAARASSYIGAVKGWAAGGFKGDPFVSESKIASEAAAVAEGERRRALNTGQQRYDDMMTKNLVRMKDVYALRGVGGVEDVRASLNKRDDFKAALAAHQGAELLKIDYEKITEMVMNRLITGKKDKK